MPDSISVFSPSHINDLLTMLWMFLAMTWAYRSRVKPLLCAGLVAACLVGGMGSILLQEKLFPNFGVYMLLFVLWGCIYGAAALKGSFLWKSAMAAGEPAAMSVFPPSARKGEPSVREQTPPASVTISAPAA